MRIGYWVTLMKLKRSENFDSEKVMVAKIDKLLNVGNPEVNNSEKLEVE